jgi:probable F420-dependent oxidoreductase
MRDLRFAFTLATHDSQRELAQTCRTAEDFGFDTAVAVDHLGPGRTAPFQGALAAALACERLRVGTYVINTGFWNPSVLAREVATAVRLTGGRLELGLGTGVVKAQFDAAGIRWHGFRGRVGKLTETLEQLDKLLAAEDGLDRPPVLVGGGSDATLRLAAERADIVSFGGRVQVPGQPPGTLGIIDGDTAARRVEYLRSVAGPRWPALELNAFVLAVEVTGDRRAAAERIVAEDPGPLTVEQALDTPFLLLGTEEEIVEQLLAHRERYGFTYFSVQRPHLVPLGPCVRRVRELAQQRSTQHESAQRESASRESAPRESAPRESAGRSHG